MRTLILIGMAFIGSSALADDYVQGYYRKDGSYVQGHYRSSSDSNPYNNYSTKGNTNPYTGKKGTKDPNGSGWGQND